MCLTVSAAPAVSAIGVLLQDALYFRSKKGLVVGGRRLINDFSATS